MRLWTLAFLLGVLLLQKFTSLPYRGYAIVIFIIAILIELFLFKKNHNFRLLSAFMLGFAWCIWYANALITWQLPENLENKPIQVSGYIATIPDTSNHGTKFLLALSTVQTKEAHGFLKLSWPNSNNKLHAGDKWQLDVKLKKVHGLMNPGGFDFEGWAFQEGICAIGHVEKSKDNNKLLTSHWYQYTINRIRQNLKDKIEKNLPVSNTSPWIIALALGERQGIAAENWAVLRNTGTNHLMAIAGLHIGFMAGFIYAIVNFFWRRAPTLTLKIPAQHAGTIAALSIGLIYSALAGFLIPTQRACIMLAVFSIVLLARRKMMAWQAWSIAVLCVLIINPLCVLTESFWLSFGSVALIIFGVSGRLAPSGLWWKLGRIQWVIAVGLIPLGIWLFQQCSIISFIANSIAIPWVGFIVEPLTFLGCVVMFFSAKLGGLILLCADKTLSVLWVILVYLSHLKWASWYHLVPDQWIILAACSGMSMLLLPVGFPGRYIGLIWLLPMLVYQPISPKEGDAWVTLLDVGQGLSAVVQTKNHILVFDAGLKLGSNFDMGESVVVPFLRSIGTQKIDMLVVSHGDNDHIGGAFSLFNYYPVALVKTSVPAKLLPFHPDYCLRGNNWQWDGVQFTFLHPSIEQLGLGNDSSCVLQVTTANNKRVLLTGDIEKTAELSMLQKDVEKLSADVLIAPHHGSKTSALNEFITAVHPHAVLYPVGYLNQYRFPHPEVVAKYRSLGVLQYDSVHAGAITFFMQENRLDFYRERHLHYWNRITS